MGRISWFGKENKWMVFGTLKNLLFARIAKWTGPHNEIWNLGRLRCNVSHTFPRLKHRHGLMNRILNFKKIIYDENRTLKLSKDLLGFEHGQSLW